MIYMSLGSNLGNRLAYIQKAVCLLKERYFSDLKCSIVLETEAIVPKGAPSEWNKPFLNMIVCGTSLLSPEALLKGLKEIESNIGRPAFYEKWAPRVIDLDILLWNDTILNTQHLTIPHPELYNRPFLVHLMAMLDPLHRYPLLPECPLSGKTFGMIAAAIPNINTCFSKSFVLYPQFVGVVNITPDSFSDGGKYLMPEKAIRRALEVSSEGAMMIELGAQSTRPDADRLTPDEEYSRLKPILERLHEHIKTGVMEISLDSFCPEVILKVLDQYPIAWINDVKGSLDDHTLMAITNYGCKIVIMHSLTIPPQKEVRLSDDIDPVDSIKSWVETAINCLLECGFKQDDVIIDPGIGFGKSSYHNLLLLRKAGQIKRLGYKVLLGHSRKSYMSTFYHSAPHERDLETIAVSTHLMDNKIDYLRIHNVRDHQRFFVAQQAIQGGFDVP